MTENDLIINPTERGIQSAFIALIAIAEPPIQHLVYGAAKVAQASLMSVTPEYDAPAEAREHRWDADQYRARARALHSLARGTKSPETRRDLIELALRHERMADYLDIRSGDADRDRAAEPE